METIEQKEDSLFIEYLSSFSIDNFKYALICINNLIDNYPNTKSRANYLLHKSICLLKLGNFEQSLNVLEELQKSDGEILGSFNFLLTKAKVLFYLSKFVEAKMTLNEALKIINAGDSDSLQILTPWLNKVDIELKEGGVIDYNSTNKGQVKIIYNWIQTGKDITIDITSNHNLVAYEIKFNKKSIDFVDKKENIVKKTINLTNAIVPEKSKVKSCNGMNCKLILVKEVPDFNWVNLEVSGNSMDNGISAGEQASYPSSSKVKKDWSKLDKEFDEQEKEDAKNDSNEGMWKLFRDIYANGNEETRRAMIKSFQTSGGTVLSTNWADVKDKDYEGKDRPEAPQGQEWAKPEK